MTNQNNILLVTGADGMVGSAIRRLDPPNTVYLGHKDLDLADFEKCKKVFGEIKPTRVIHLAAVVGGIGGNTIHSGEFFRQNVMINVNTLEAARLVGVKKLLSFMSTCIFPAQCDYPLNEKDLHKGPPHPSNFGYAYAKRMLEVQSSAYRKEWGCDFIVGIPTNIYGPNDYFNIEDGHVMPSLIHKIYLAKKNGTDFSVWGSGQPLREFVYVDDIAKLALWALNNYTEDSPIIFTSGNEISIKDLVGLVAKAMNFTGNIVYDSTKPDGQFRKPSDGSKLKKYYPDFVFTPIEDGIQKTVDWFLANYPNVRK